MSRLKESDVGPNSNQADGLLKVRTKAFGTTWSIRRSLSLAALVLVPYQKFI